MDLSGQHSEITFFRTTEDLSPFTEDEVKIDVVIEFDIYVIFRLACSSDFVGTVEMTGTNEEGIDGNPDRTRKIGEADLIDHLQESSITSDVNLTFAPSGQIDFSEVKDTTFQANTLDFVNAAWTDLPLDRFDDRFGALFQMNRLGTDARGETAEKGSGEEKDGAAFHEVQWAWINRDRFESCRYDRSPR